MSTTTSPTVVTVTDPAEAHRIAEVAAATFPLACPPHCTAEDIAAHTASALSADRFAEHIAAADREVLAVLAGDDVIGYALLVHGIPDDPDVAAAVSATPEGGRSRDAGTVTELSKVYVLPDHHGANDARRPAHVLMAAALAAARERGSDYAWLGVNALNRRAQKYYSKMGFSPVGTRTFDMNGTIEHDLVLGRAL